MVKGLIIGGIVIVFSVGGWLGWATWQSHKAEQSKANEQVRQDVNAIMDKAEAERLERDFDLAWDRQESSLKHQHQMSLIGKEGYALEQQQSKNNLELLDFLQRRSQAKVKRLETRAVGK